MPRINDNYALVIPARYKSSRFPGKPLVKIKGKSMIRRVWEKCVEAVGESKVYIATDDDKILQHSMAFTKNVIMTSEHCLTGTDRVTEIANKLSLDFVLNVQGDEPLVSPADIKQVRDAYLEGEGSIINAMCKIHDRSEFYSLTVPKVVFSSDRYLLYMSRSPVPGNKENQFNLGWKQVCIYAYSTEILNKFSQQQRKKKISKYYDFLRWVIKLK